MSTELVEANEWQMQLINSIVVKLHEAIKDENIVASLTALIDRLAFVIVHLSTDYQKQFEDCVVILEHRVNHYKDGHRECGKYRDNKNTGVLH